MFDRLRLKSTPKHRAKDSTRRPQDTDSSACALIYTSGTTGLPKSRDNVLEKGIYGFSYLWPHYENQGKLECVNSNAIIPFYCSNVGVCPTLIVGGCVTVSQKFSATSFWTQARLCGATHIQYVGEVCRYLLNSKPHPDQDRHNVRIAYGNGLRRDIWSEFKSRFHIDGIGEFYAATESPIATTNLQYGEYGVGACRKYGSIINLFYLHNKIS